MYMLCLCCRSSKGSMYGAPISRQYSHISTTSSSRRSMRSAPSRRYRKPSVLGMAFTQIKNVTVSESKSIKCYCARYMYNIHVVHVMYMYSTCDVHVQYMRCHVVHILVLFTQKQDARSRKPTLHSRSYAPGSLSTFHDDTESVKVSKVA